MTLTVGEVLRRTNGYLAERGCDSPRLDAELLLAAVLGVERIVLYTEHDRPLTNDETERYREFVARRGRREPVAYILGRRGFRHLDLAVGPAVLVPRPETEVLVEWAVEVAPTDGTVLDWGTGSGAIALAVAHERPDLTVTAIDVSTDALAIARRNDPQGRVEWVASDGFASLDPDRRFDLIVANPPYLSNDELAAAAPELAHEPPGALAAGPTGLEALRRIVAESPAHLIPGGWLGVELGIGQAGPVSEDFAAHGFASLAVKPDLAGIDRVVVGMHA